MNVTAGLTLNTLRINKDIVALESGILTSMSNLLANTFPTISREFTGFVGRFNAPSETVALTSDQNKFLHEINNYKYLDIAPIRAFVPEGMDTTYIAYFTALKDATEHCEHIVETTMNDYALFLGSLINNTDSKFDTTNFVPVYKTLNANRDKLNDRLAKCFLMGSTKAEVTIGDVISRNTDWKEVFELSEKMLKEIQMVNRSKLDKKIVECVQLISIIQNKIKRNEFEGISPQAINNLSEGAFQIASELEFYSVTHYRVLAATTSVNRTIENFRKLFSK
jgi:hypothetical protein